MVSFSLFLLGLTNRSREFVESVCVTVTIGLEKTGHKRKEREGADPSYRSTEFGIMDREKRGGNNVMVEVELLNRECSWPRMASKFGK